MEILTSRELAIVIWITIILIYFMTKKEIRQSFFDVLKIFFGGKLIMIWSIYIFYVFILSLLFTLLPFWDNIFIKDILVWTIFSGIIDYMNAFSREADETYIKKIIKEKFKLIIILECIMNTFTFNIIFELLYIPIITIIALMSYIAEKEIKNQEIQKFFDIILVIIGVIFIYKTIKVGIIEYKNLNKWNTFISFTISIVYLIFTLPLIYLIQLYSNYEFIFTRMSLKEVEKEKVNRKRRFIILRRCKYSVRKTLIVQKEYLPKIYKNMSENEFENLLNELK